MGADRDTKADATAPVAPPPSAEPSSSSTAPAFDWEAFNPKEKVLAWVQEYRKVDSEEGTALRKYFGQARAAVSDTFTGIQAKVNDAQTSIREKVEEIAPVVKKFEGEFDSFDGFRKRHRELTIGGTALVVALPSAIGGKRRALVNGVLAGGAMWGFLGLLDFWERRKKKEP